MSGAGTVMRVPVLALTDPRNARILLIVAYSLFTIGVLMLIGTIYWWRHSKVDHPALRRLETLAAPRPAAAGAADLAASDGEGESTKAEGRPTEEPASAAIDPLLRPADSDVDAAVAPGYGGAHG